MFKKGYKQTEQHKRKIGKANAISHIGFRHSEVTKRKMGIAKLGSKNNRWKGGISPYPNIPLLRTNRYIILIENPDCEICGKKAQCVHHKDEKKTDHRLSNLQAVCRKCHSELHIVKRFEKKFEKSESELLTNLDSYDIVTKIPDYEYLI